VYEDFYRLSADPFRLSPDPRFRYDHPGFVRARVTMQHALRRGDGVLLLTGAPGTGKTTLVEVVLADPPRDLLHRARLIAAQLQPDEVLRRTADAFGLEGASENGPDALRALASFLHRELLAGRRALLVVDEAQGLTPPALEELRLLTSLHEAGRPLLQLFLVGHDSLRDLLRGPGLEPLRLRLASACHLDPLDAAETRAFVEHRLQRVGWRGDPALGHRALALVHRVSGGLPRRINQVCSRLFWLGATTGRRRLGANEALAVIEEMRRDGLLPAGLATSRELAEWADSLRPDRLLGSLGNAASVSTLPTGAARVLRWQLDPRFKERFRGLVLRPVDLKTLAGAWGVRTLTGSGHLATRPRIGVEVQLGDRTLLLRLPGVPVAPAEIRLGHRIAV
jgi:type II secretory pathway predicted ATPase ExeA